MKKTTNAVLAAAVVAGAVTSSAWVPAGAEEVDYRFFYHPRSFYDPTVVPEPSQEEQTRTPVSKKYDAGFVKSKGAARPATASAAPTAAQSAAEPAAPVQLVPVTDVAPQGEVPATAAQKAAQMQQEFGIPVADLHGLTMEQLTELDMKIRTISRLQNRYGIAPEPLVRQSLDALQKLEWNLQQGR